MAYIVDLVTTNVAAAASAVPALPDHAENDLLLACCSQDGGGTAIAGTGWTSLGTQAASGAARQAWLWKWAGASESDPTFTGANDEWAITIFAIRDADPTTPFDGVTPIKNDWNAVNTAVAPSVTTNTANCLIFRSWISDSPGADEHLRLLPGDLMIDVMGGNECVHVIGHEVQSAAGATGTKTAYSASAIEGGNAWTLAIRNASGGSFAPHLSGGATKIAWYGPHGLQHDIGTTGWSGLTDIAATIDSLTVDSLAATAANAGLIDATVPWGHATALTHTITLGADAWTGGVHAISSTNMSGKLFSVDWGTSYVTGMGAKGAIVVFADVSGNWVAYQILPLNQQSVNKFYTPVIALGTAAVLASSGTMNWADVRKIGYGTHRSAGTSQARSIYVRNALLHSAPVLVGGGANNPVTSLHAEQALSRANYYYLAYKQGSAQVLSQTGVQIGDGTKVTYFDAEASSLELPLPRSVRRARYLWNVGENGVEVRIKTSASDTVLFRSTVVATASKQKFIIDPTSSPSATYDFAGGTITGFEVTWQDGIPCVGANFVGCYTITANGGTFTGCDVQSSLSAIALTTTDPAAISDCNFTGTGHALELTVPGTYTFAGNTFTGYGVDGTTDAAIYNNSGGAVTLNITGGGDTPTVKNGTGATTTVNNNITITLEGLAIGSSILLEKVSDGSTVEFRVADTTTEVFSVAGSVAYLIKVRKASGSPYYRPWSTTTTPVNDVSITVSQELDE